MSLEPGKKLLHYRVTEKIGAGGMGEVWKGVDTTLDREVAIKVLPEGFESDGDRLTRFSREAKLLASLNHPNIASAFGLHQADGVHFIAMEWVPGEDLAARLTRGPLSLEDTLGIAREVAQALEAAHDAGVIHRDLKPANIRLTPDDKIKVLDFGLARGREGTDSTPSLSNSPTMTAQMTQAGMIIGTASYMSPEQARGKRVDQRSDIFSFGCVLFELLAGRPAFPGETAAEILAGVLKSEPDWNALPSETPWRIRQLLQRCLRKDSSQRVHHAADVRIEIQEALVDPAVDARANTTSPAHHPRWQAVIPWFLAIAMTGVAIVAFLASMDDERTESSSPSGR